jgi:hypothetical protein
MSPELALVQTKLASELLRLHRQDRRELINSLCTRFDCTEDSLPEELAERDGELAKRDQVIDKLCYKFGCEEEQVMENLYTLSRN